MKQRDTHTEGQPAQFLAALLLAAVMVACSGGGAEDMDPDITGDNDPDPTVECNEEPCDPAEPGTVFSSAGKGIVLQMGETSIPLAVSGQTLTLTAATFQIASLTLPLPSGLNCDAVDAAVTSEIDGDTVAPACSSDGLSFGGPFTVDPIDTGDNPLSDLGIAVGSYDGLTVGFDGSGDPTLIAYASYTTDLTTPIRMQLHVDGDLAVSLADGVSAAVIDGSTAQDLLVDGDADGWLAAVTAAIESCLENTTTTLDAGVLVLDDDVTSNDDCDDLESALVDGLLAEATLSVQDRP